MTGRILLSLCAALLLPLLQNQARAGEPSGFEGSWELLREKSSDIDLFGTLSLKIHVAPDSVLVLYTWGKGREIHDTLALRTGGVKNSVRVWDRVWPSNVFMGVSLIPGSRREVAARVQDSTLVLEERCPVASSQGETSLQNIHTFRLSPDGETVRYSVARSTRPKTPALTYVLKREGWNTACVMEIEDSWEVTGKLSVQALLLSLQGLANTDSARLYFLYPPDWPFTFTRSVYDFYRTKRNFTFTSLASAAEALARLGRFAKGYVVWDRKVRSSLGVAFTIAGLERALVVDDSLAPMAERAGLRPVADLRGRFEGKTDAEIYAWAYREYGARCSKDLIVWLGGEAGRVMKPSIADYGISRKAFFTDLSARPSDSAEYALADRILDGMNPTALVMGWHSYAKDLEEEFVTLTSHHGLAVEGLNTLPNNSFSAHVPASRGFVFRNHHHLTPGKPPVPAGKVYVSCIQTDGMGLGSWLEPGRGTIPYAWEVTMNWVWMAPAMLEYFYTMATPNDYLIGCLSGPGYMYPKAVPPALLPGAIARAYAMMKQLDLNVFEVMDYSEGRTIEGNTELAKNVVQAYYDGMPDVVGFVNGYAPGFTFTTRGGRPFISYDYYLSPVRPEAEAVSDLRELARINSRRPYFLLVHVREYSDVKRVKGILDKLGSGFEVVPLDVFLAMAGKRPTFKEKFLHAPTSTLP